MQPPNEQPSKDPPRGYHEPLLRELSALTFEMWCLISAHESRVIDCSRAFLKLWELPAELAHAGMLALQDDRILTVRAAGQYSGMLPAFGKFIDLMKEAGMRHDQNLLSDAMRSSSHAILDPSGEPIGQLVFLTPQSSIVPAIHDLAAVRRAVTLMNNLSGRERQVAELIYSGYTNRAISLELDISEKTVEKYRANAMEKLGSNCIAAMIRTMVLARLGAGIAP